MENDSEQDHLQLISIDDEIYKIIKSNVKVKVEYLDSLLRNVKIDLKTDCWLKGKDWSSYQFVKIIPAHRLSYLMFNGVIPNKLVCHHCDRKGCINPLHLFIGSYSDNMRDARKKGRVFSPSFRKKNKCL